MILFTLFGTKVFSTDLGNTNIRYLLNQIFNQPHKKLSCGESQAFNRVFFCQITPSGEQVFYESLTWSATCFEMTLRFRFFVTDLLQIGHKFEGAPPSIFLWRIWTKSVTFFLGTLSVNFFVTDLDQIRHIFLETTLPVRFFCDGFRPNPSHFFEATLPVRVFATDLDQIRYIFERTFPSVFLWRIWTKSFTFFFETTLPVRFVCDGSCQD